ncbi:MAG TPA: TonB-dependent receptor, partial [Longimicrobiales bacterium]|nr:TonB-dependent receptor [Longimicrobiales bacterium]
MSLSRALAIAALVATSCLPDPARAQQPTAAEDSVQVYQLEPLSVVGRVDDLIGTVSSASIGYVGYRDLRARPLSREGELLETIPGMILTQHSGDGKSNQMFVRGFNLDHGTDFSTKLEEIPINFPAHAHGHGYTDLNLLIPELVDHIEYSLGNYYAEIGDFSAAGGADIHLRSSLEEPLFVAGIGSNAHRRVVAAASAGVGAGGSLLGAGELRGYDGPWDVPQELRKASGMLRYTREGEGTSLSLLALGYDGSWNSSDQIPLRAVESGLIGRFGQIDPTLGGETSRYVLSGRWTRATDRSGQRVMVYAQRYALDLYGNFTYNLDRPVTGDQVLQEDRGRWTIGADLAYLHVFGAAGVDHQLTIGGQLRLDEADLALSRTSARAVAGAVRTDDVSQGSVGTYAEVESSWSDTFRSTLGLRGDYYDFDVRSNLSANSGAVDAAIASPKLSLAFGPWGDTELYLSGGLGFHSNDARGTVTTVDPSTGDPIEPVPALVRSTGAEVGLRSSAIPGLRSTVSLWTIHLDSELRFIGDTGTTEPSDPSRRFGVTLANYYAAESGLTLDLDFSFTRARTLNVPSDRDRIPGALENVLAAGVGYERPGDGPFGALRLRHFGAYPLTEDDAERAEASSLFNVAAGWRLGSARLEVSVLNLLDEDHSDVQY